MNEEILNDILDAVQGVNTRLDKIDAKVDSLETKVNSLETEVRSVKLTIENEIRPNIAEIASCHLDLSKKLDAVTASYESYSDLKIRVRVLESQMRELRMAQ